MVEAMAPRTASAPRPARAGPFFTRGLTPWPQLITELDAVRDTAVAAEHQQTGVGHSCVATGIHGSDGSLIGVIGVAGRLETYRHTGWTRAHRAMRNRQASRSGGSGVGAFFGGLLAVGLLVVFVLIAVSLLGL